MANSDDEKYIGLPILKKKSIFSNWIFRIHLFLEQKGVLEVLLVRQQKNTRNKVYFKKKDCTARFWIVQSVDDELLDIVNECKTAQEMIMKLQAHFQRTTTFSKYELKKKLLMMKFEVSDSLQMHFEKFDQLISDLDAIGCKLGESDKVCHLLLTLPDEYKVIITSLDIMLALSESLKIMEFVKSKLLEAEMRVQLNQTNINNVGLTSTEQRSVPTSLLFSNIREDLALNGGTVESSVSRGFAETDNKRPTLFLTHSLSFVEPVISNITSSAADQSLSPDVIDAAELLNDELITDDPDAGNAQDCLDEKYETDSCSEYSSTNLNAVASMSDSKELCPDNADLLRTDSPVSLETKPEDCMLDCRVILRDAANKLWCSVCDQWCLSAAQLQTHKDEHVSTSQFSDKEQSENHHITSQSGLPEISDNILNTIKVDHFENSEVLIQPANLHIEDYPGHQTTDQSIFEIIDTSSAQLLERVDAIPGPSSSDDMISACDTKNSDLKSRIVQHNRSAQKVYKCRFCTKILLTESGWAQHLLKVHNEKQIYTCDDCKQSFTFKRELIKHIGTHKKPHTCKVCNKQFTRARYLEIHSILHDDRKPVECDKCGKSFKVKRYLKVHKKKYCQGDVKNIGTGVETAQTKEQKVHQSDGCTVIQSTFPMNMPKDDIRSILNVYIKKPRKYYFFCKHCGRGFTSKLAMLTHTYSHTGEKNFQCEVCNKRFSSLIGVKCHTSNMHSGDKPFACEICCRRFTKIAMYKIHLLIHGEKKVECNECGHRFSTKRHLVPHLRTHSEARPFICNVCNKGFKSKYLLKTHLATHNKRQPLICPICGKSLISKMSLNNHVKASHPEETENKYICDYCGKQFNVKTRLVYHIEVHQKDKCFPCTICKKPFTRKLYLDRHKVTHGDRKYSCTICGQRFFYKSTYNRHMKAPHQLDVKRWDRPPRK